MLIGYPSRDRAMVDQSPANVVLRTGTMVATDPLAQRAPAVLRRQLEILGRRHVQTGEVYPQGVRSDGAGAIRMLQAMATQMPSGAIVVDDPGRLRKDVNAHGPGILPYKQMNGALGYVRVNPESRMIDPGERISELRQQTRSQNPSAQRAAAEYSARSPTPNRTRAAGYGWRGRY